MVFGQGYATTALQMVNAYSTIANGGVRMQQSLVESSTSPQGTTVSNIKKNGTRVLSEKTSSQLMDMMESVTDGLEATKVRLAGYRIAGKSGTAQAQPHHRRLDWYYPSGEAAVHHHGDLHGSVLCFWWLGCRPSDVADWSVLDAEEPDAELSSSHVVDPNVMVK